jgi:hypothetical protein
LASGGLSRQSVPTGKSTINRWHIRSAKKWHSAKARPDVYDFSLGTDRPVPAGSDATSHALLTPLNLQSSLR